MMKLTKHIPNALTCLNLLSGALSIIYTLHEGEMALAMWLIVLSAVFDFFDGLVARWLGVSSPIGKDLDSLADVVSFGLAPAVLLLHGLWQQDASFWGAMPSLLLVAFAALRLAKFNNDTRQSTSFIGLPVPANALFWIGITQVLPELKILLGKDFMMVGVYTLIALFSFLMVSEIPMFSFKVKALSMKSPQLWLVLISLGLLLLFGLSGSAYIIVAYILLSIIGRNR